MTQVTRQETNTARFGRVVTYRTTVGDVHFSAERMVGLDESYHVSTHVGRCGMSFCQPRLAGERVAVAGGRGVAERLIAVAERIVAARAFVSEHRVDLCTDRPACDRYREGERMR